MAVYDYNGTGCFEIGKVYDCDGTVSHQIGKVYDNNGTTDSLLYTADETVYPGCEVTTDYYAPQGSYSVGSFYANSNNTSGGWSRAYTTVDVSEWTTLTLSVTYHCDIYAQLFVGLCTNFAATPGSMGGYIRASAILNTGANAQTGTETFTLDVSQLTGTLYLGIEAYSGSSVSAGTGATVNSAVLS